MRRVDIPMMRDTTGATRPFSYPQRTQSTRPTSSEAARASDTGERFPDRDADTSKPNGFVGQLMSDHAPARIIGRFGHLGFGHKETSVGLPALAGRGKELTSEGSMPDGVTIIYKLDEPSMGESSFKGRLPPLGGSPVRGRCTVDSIFTRTYGVS
jgi:hypothetical protein